MISVQVLVGPYNENCMGMALFKYVDISKIEADGKPIVMEKLIDQWIKENPERDTNLQTIL